METEVQDQTTQSTPQTQVQEPDPFALDESKFISLTPEQRASLDPVLQEWKTKAKAEIDSRTKSYEEKYKPHMEKAQALDELVKDPRFQGWWTNIQKQAIQANPGGAQATAQAKPQDFATEQEWQEAWQNAYQGDYQKFRDIQARMFSIMATPVVQKLQEGQAELKTTLEMKDLFERHPDAKELDSIGRNATDPNDKSESLLESCLNWAEENGRPLEEGYMRAKKWADSLKVGAQQQAMGLVQEKKQSVTSGPTTQKAGPQIVEVADADELMAKNMEYLASGQTPPKFVIRGQGNQSGTRWAQRQ